MMTEMTSTEQPHQRDAEHSDCAREPIHIPGSIQPHGVLLALAEHAGDVTVVQASENVAELLGLPAQELLGKSIGQVLGQDFAIRLRAEAPTLAVDARPLFVCAVSGSPLVAERGTKRLFHAVAHRTGEGIILELELAAAEDPTADFHPRLDAFTMKAEACTRLADLSQLTAAEVRHLTGFDRVLIYQFDSQWHGVVVGEDGTGRLPSYLHHRFPASDIPAQARELYRKNRVRIIPDAGYRPVPLKPALCPLTNKPLDMSFSTLRSVSPVHVQYMRNMETASSMSISILRNGQLWGLIACHHCEPKRVPFQIRGTCDLVGRVFALRIAALEHSQDYERRIEVQAAYAKLLACMSGRADFAAALAENEATLLSFVAAGGAAILNDDECTLLGRTPTEAQVRELAGWLFTKSEEEVYSTDSLGSVFPTARAYKDKASGLLAIAISKLHPSYVLWFRPEVLKTVPWGGDPSKVHQYSGHHTTLHPRKSFETWKETVSDKSLPWNPSELEASVELRNIIVGTVLRKAEELVALNAELTRSNKELEAFSYSVSHDLRAPLRHIVGYAEMLKEGGNDKLTDTDRRYLNTIIESCEYAGNLVDKLLKFSRLGRADLQRARVDMSLLVHELQQSIMADVKGRNIIWKVAALPTVRADLMMIRMAMGDLLSNAVKYTRHQDPAIIEIGARLTGPEYVFSVKDNGVGFDMAYVDKLFGVFQRLHKWEEFEGTGIGLANVRRVMERHGGRTWAVGEEGKGAIFYFTLPKLEAE